MSSANSSLTTSRKRSRAGCHTCKSRKVKCESQENQISQQTSCANCQRLGFQCRWQPPAAGEEYAPPPKRRRTIGQRRRTEPLSEKEHATVSIHNASGDSKSDDVQQNTSLSAESTETARSSAVEGNTQTSQDQLDMFGSLDLNYDVDLGLAYGSLDLNLAGEGLDFIPTPTIDTSLLHDNTSFATTHYPDALPALAPNQEFTALDRTENTTAMGTASNNSGSTAVNSSNSSINPHNRHLIQHYLDVMTGYAKIDDNAKYSNNLFISAFTKSLHFPPLFHAILSFSASHLAMENPSYLDQAADLSRLAGESFDTFRHAEEFEADGLLSALFVRVKTVHLLAGSVDSFLELIAAAADIVSAKHDRELASSNSVRDKEFASPLTRRVILRLAILDGRASFYRIGGGQLVNLLREIPAFSSLFTRQLPPKAGTDDYSLLSLLRADILRMKVADLDVELHEQLKDEFVTHAPVRLDRIKTVYNDIQYEIDQWNTQMHKESGEIHVEQLLIEDKVLDATEYGYYIVLSALHSALLYLYTVYPILSFDVKHSVSKVLECQLKMSHDPSRATSPSSILPSSIFMAGLTTSDPVHIHWILQLFKAAGKWGIYIKKGQQLLEEMLRQPPGTDIRDIMDKVTGRFII